MQDEPRLCASRRALLGQPASQLPQPARPKHHTERGGDTYVGRRRESVDEHDVCGFRGLRHDDGRNHDDGAGTDQVDEHDHHRDGHRPEAQQSRT